MAKFIKNPFRKSSTSGQPSEKQETPPTFHPSRQPVDTQFDMGTPTVESGGSLFEGMDFDADDVIETPQPVTQDSSDLSSSALPLDLNLSSDKPPPITNPSTADPHLIRDEVEDTQDTHTTTLPSSGSAQKRKTRKAKFPGGVPTGNAPRSTNSTPTPRGASPAEAEMVSAANREDEGKRERSQLDIRESVDKLLLIINDLECSRKTGELAFERRASQLKSRCQLQQKRQEVNQLIREAEELEDFSAAERLSTELEGVDRELRECDVRRDLLDVWTGFYSDLMQKYMRDVDKLEQTGGVSQEAADRLEQEARREEQEYVRQTEEQRRELSLLVEKQDHAKRQLGLDREHMQRQRQILEDDVTTRTEQLLQERTQLETRVQSLGEEIEELERKLSRLKSNRGDALSDLSAVEERLDAVYDSVREEKRRLEADTRGVESQEEELERQDRDIAERQSRFSAQEREHKDVNQGVRDKIDRLRHAPRLVACMKSVEMETQGYPEELEAVLFTQMEEAHSSKLNLSVANLSAEIDQVSVSRQTCQEELSGLEWSLSKGEDKIRELDSVKKGLTQVKKYKEARETAEERKKVSDKQEQLKLEIECKTLESSKLSREFEQKCSALESARMELSKEEERSDANIMKCLQELTNNLCKSVQLEGWDPRMELRGYKLKLFELYKEELCIKHGWEYIQSVVSINSTAGDRVGMEPSNMETSETQYVGKIVSDGDSVRMDECCDVSEKL